MVLQRGNISQICVLANAAFIIVSLTFQAEKYPGGDERLLWEHESSEEAKEGSQAALGQVNMLRNDSNTHSLK